MAHHFYRLLDYFTKMDFAPVRSSDLNVPELFSGREHRKEMISRQKKN